MSDDFHCLAVDGAGVVLSGARSNVAQTGMIEVTSDLYADATSRLGRCRLIDGNLVDYAPPPPPAVVPDNPTLSDWRVGLTLWKMPDGTLRLDQVTARVNDLVASGHPFGRIARERLEYANNVLRGQLMQLASVLAFTSSEIDESLYRADRVSKGDLSGVWPLASV